MDLDLNQGGGVLVFSSKVIGSQAMIQFQKPLLIYIPAYNVRGKILKTISEIPAHLWDKAEVLVVDNCSSDGTGEAVAEAARQGAFPGTVHVVRCKQNRRYAGSEKLAWRLAAASPAVEWVIVLHGDGQYPPDFIDKFLARAAEGNTPAIVYGVRSKRIFGSKEETPWITYLAIRGLSLLESIVTGCWYWEWHTGYVMYHRSFLAAVDLDRVTTTQHSDGNMMFLAGHMKREVRPLYIYKRYKGYEEFAGLPRIKYVLGVLPLMFRFRFNPDGDFSDDPASKGLGEFDVL